MINATLLIFLSKITTILLPSSINDTSVCLDHLIIYFPIYSEQVEALLLPVHFTINKLSELSVLLNSNYIVYSLTLFLYRIQILSPKSDESNPYFFITACILFNSNRGISTAFSIASHHEFTPSSRCIHWIPPS